MDARESEMTTRRYDREEFAPPPPGRGYAAVEQDDPEIIKSRIDRTRAEMDATVTALQQRLTWQNLMHEGKSRVGERMKGKGIPLALIGSGIAMWMMERRKNKQFQNRVHVVAVPVGPPDEVGRGRDSDWLAPGAQYWDRRRDLSRGSGESGGGGGSGLGQRAHEVGDRLRDRAGDISGRASHMMHDVGDRASAFTSNARDRVSDMADDARYNLHRAQRGFWDTYEGNPLLLGAGAFALGIAAGVAIPTTRAENKLMGEASDEMARKARRLGEDALHRGQRIAEKAMETADEVSSAAGGLKDEVKSQGRELMGKAKNEVGGSSGSSKNLGGSGLGGSVGGTGIGSSQSTHQSAQKTPGKGGSTGPSCPTDTSGPVI